MKAYFREHTMKEDGALTLKKLPFDFGEKIELIIIPRSKRNSQEKWYPFWGKPITYPDRSDCGSGLGDLHDDHHGYAYPGLVGGFIIDDRLTDRIREHIRANEEEGLGLIGLFSARLCE